MIIFLNVFSKNSYNNQKTKTNQAKNNIKNKTIDNNKHYSLPFNNLILQIHNSNKYYQKYVSSKYLQ